MGSIAQLRGVDAKSTATNYFGSLLNGLASLFLAMFVPTFLTLARDIAAEHAPGLTAVAGGLVESFFTLPFGILFLVFFSLFYFARHSSRPGLRISLFWLPASLLTVLGLAVWAWGVFMMRLLERSQPVSVQ